MDAGVDPVFWARLLRRAYDRSVSRQPGQCCEPSTIVRPIIAASWARALEAGIDPTGRPPLMLEPAETVRAIRQPPLSAVLPIVDRMLTRVADYAHQAVAVADAAGHILWVSGHAETRQKAARVNLVPGALWSEGACGTNAVGTAIRLDHPLQVFSAEHFKPLLHGWSFAAAPVHHPETEELIGVIVLAGSLKRAHPHGFSMAVAAAQTAEAQLRHEASQRDERLKVEYLERVLSGCADASAVVNPHGRVLLSTPSGWLGSRVSMSAQGAPLPPLTDQVRVEPICRGNGFMIIRDCGQSHVADRAVLRLQAMGRERATGTLGRRSFEFTPRHSEILVILAQHPEGMSDDDLAAALYGSAIKSVTIRAEISRLRRLLGTVIRTRPYRLVADVQADFLDLLAGAGAGSEHPGVRPGAVHHAQLLPASTAPGVVAIRTRIQSALAAHPSDGGVADAAAVAHRRRGAV